MCENPDSTLKFSLGLEPIVFSPYRHMCGIASNFNSLSTHAGRKRGSGFGRLGRFCFGRPGGPAEAARACRRRAVFRHQYAPAAWSIRLDRLRQRNCASPSVAAQQTQLHLHKCPCNGCGGMRKTKAISVPLLGSYKAVQALPCMGQLR